MAIYSIKRANLTSNIAYFDIPCAEAFQIGESVTVAGCTTSTFNTTLTVLTSGLVQVTPASTTGYSENFSGFSASLTHGNIATEVEPTGATATTSFGTGTSSQTLLYDGHP